MITKDSKNILVADDSLFFRTKLSDILVEAGHRVRFAKDGNEAINEIEIDCNGIDLLSLDLQMPNADGFSVLEWINENGHKGKFPILVVTGLHEPSHVIDRLKNLGAAGLMTKAFTPEHTIFRVNQLLFPDKWKCEKMRKRVPVSIPVDYTVETITRTGYILSLSDTGIFLHSKADFYIGIQVALQFSLPGLNKVLDMDGTIKWLTQEKSGKRFFCGYGITFNSINEEDLEILRNFVDAEIKRLGLEDVM